MNTELIKFEVVDNKLLLNYEELKKKIEHFDKELEENEREDNQTKEKVSTLEKEIENQKGVIKSALVLSKEVSELRAMVLKLVEKEKEREEEVKVLKQNLEVKEEEVKQILSENKQKQKEIQQMQVMKEESLKENESLKARIKEIEKGVEELEKVKINDFSGKVQCVVCKEMVPVDDILEHVTSHSKESKEIVEKNEHIDVPPAVKPIVITPTVIEKKENVPIKPTAPCPIRPIEPPKVVEVPNVIEPTKPVELPKVVEPIKPIEVPKVEEKIPIIEVCECPVCGKKFAADKLAQHVDSHFSVQEPTFACPFCNKDMKDANTLQRHVAQNHANLIN